MIKVNGEEITLPYKISLDDMGGNDPYITIRKKDDYCILTYLNKQGSAIGVWIEWEYEQVIVLYRGMFISGQFIGNYDYDSKYPELIKNGDKVYLMLR